MVHSPPTISVIVPVHNRPTLLARALDSVQRQTFAEWEVIVIDDASDPPATLGACADDPRFRLLRHDGNRGPSAARNTGLEAARGDYVAFLDSDDEWRPEKLSAQLAEMRADAQRFFVCGAATADGATIARTLPHRAKRPGERIAAYLYVANQFAQASCMLAPVTMARLIGFDPGLRQYEDHLFLMRAEAAGFAVEVSTAPLTLHHVDARPDRLGRRDDPLRAATFLRAADGLLLPHEEMAFRLRCMTAETPPRKAARLAFAAMRMRGAPLGAALKVLARALVGASAYAAVQGARRRAEAIRRWST